MQEAKLLVLDTSHFGQWVRDACSRRADDRRRASAFGDALDRAGWVCAFGFEHIAEIHGHADPDVRTNRLTFIRAMPLIAYVRARHGLEAGFGSVVDVLGAEIAAALKVGTSEPAAVAAAARPNVFAYAPGSDVMRHLDDAGPILGDMLRAQASRNRRTVALSRAEVERPPDVTVAELVRLPLRTEEDREAFMERFGAKMVSEVVDRGDRRIEDPRAVADGLCFGVQL